VSLAVHLRIVGVSLIALGLAHGLFPKRFRWKEELARLTLLNRQIFLVHCFFIALVLVLVGALSVAFTELFVEPSPLARVVLVGLVVYDRALWRGDRGRTLIHAAFVALWSYYVAVYAVALGGQL
jgi:hypothetical protein